MFATFKELLAYAELVKQLTQAGDDQFGAGCLVKCYADGVTLSTHACCVVMSAAQCALARASQKQ